MRMVSGLLAVSVALAAGLGCGDDVAPYDRNAMLTDVAQSVVIPAHQALAQKGDALGQAASAACEDGQLSEQELVTVREAWWQAREAMELLPAFSVGPWRTQGIGALLDRWPTDDVEIDRLLAGSATLDDAFLKTLGANKRGLPALEHLLWPQEGAFEGERRCALVALLSRDVAAQSDALLEGWTREGGFAVQLGQAGRVEGMYRDPQEALGELANIAVAAIELIVGTQLAKPMGLTTGGTGQPKLAKSWRSERSLEVARLNLESAWRLYNGVDGAKGLGDMVQARNSATDARVREAFDAAFAALDAVPGTLEDAVLVAPDDVVTAREALRVVLRLWRTEVIGALGVSLTFNDNDGD